MIFNENNSRVLFDELYRDIRDLGMPEEQKAKVYILLEERLNITRTDVIAAREVTLSTGDYEQLRSDLQKLKEGVPVQYVVGKSWFYGRPFFVDQNVLIPRPETEELVHLIIKENKDRSCKIMDVGIGSGCIAITLKAEMKDAEVWGLDVSQGALEVAHRNARTFKLNVKFIRGDIFDDPQGLPQVDILVSNPPYVPEKEKQDMQPEVLLHEPGEALFVKDRDPVIFYRRIAEAGTLLLNDGGKLYFEIHKDFGEAVKNVLKTYGYKNIKVIKDIHNKDRIVSAVAGIQEVVK